MTPSSKCALIIGSVWPEPKSSAAGWRTLSILESLQQQGWTITFASTASNSPHRLPLEPLGILEQGIKLNHPSFDTFVRELNPQLVLFDRFTSEEQFGWRVAEQCPDALRILDTQDLHCLRDARQQALKLSRAFDPETIQTEKACREIASIYRCDLSLIISPFEMVWLQTRFGIPAELLHHLPFLLDPLSPEAINAWPGFAHREHYVSIGNFRHPPNWDAVQYLKNTLWPLIRQRQPDAQIHLYGAYPTRKVTQLHAPRDGFQILGWAENAHQVLSRARVCLAPLRFGAGLKGKLAEAMQSGTPSVTTAIGAEGMFGALPWSGLIADNPAQLADAAVRLYQDRELWQTCQQRGIDILNQQFHKPQLQTRWIQALDDRLENLNRYRTRNFTGAMLQHHALQSSRYMARWIEAKNKIDVVE